MNNPFVRILPALAGVALTLGARADEPTAVELVEAAPPSRWHFTVGARVAPGVKTRAGVSSRAVADAAGRLSGANGSRRGAALPSGSSTAVERTSATSSDTSSETLSLTPTSRLEFDHGFVDMADDAGIPGETAFWHFDATASFDEGGGRLATASDPKTETSRESSSSRSVGQTVSSASVRSTFSETVAPDAASSREDDLWGADFEIGRDLWRGERLSLGLAFGATFYRGEDAVRAAGRCYEAESSTVRETASGRFVTTTDTTVETTRTATETTAFTDPGFAYAGALDDIRNDDGSFGAGTADGYTNPYGGNKPVLTLSDGSVTKTTATDTTTDTTVETTRTFEAAGTKTDRASARRTIDVAADGDVEMQELRLALQPSWRATDWLELRGSLGAVATRVAVDVDATVFVNGARSATVSGSDDDWVFAGLCGLDAVIRPAPWLEIALGGDVRLGDAETDYRAGLASGSVELARYTLRAGIGVRF